jgi:hypothetical protein
MKHHANEQSRHEREALDPSKAPKYVLGPADDQLHVGSVVFYHGERHHVSIVPTSWEESHHIRICDKRMMRDPNTNGLMEDKHAVCFACHADVVNLAPPTKQRNPTVKSLQRAARAQVGVRDVGDEVAELLRPLTLPEMFEVAASYLGEDLQALLDKYTHLDNGRKRMVLGNRMRAKHKKEEQS